MRKKQIQRHIEKDGRDIKTVHSRNTSIRSATGIAAPTLHVDNKYKLRDEFEFKLDERNKRTPAGTILSREGIDKDKLVIAAARFVFERGTWGKFTDSDFTELTDGKEDRVYGAPIVDQFEWGNVDYSKAALEGARWPVPAKMAHDLGEKSIIDIKANKNVVLVANAYNYEDKRERKNRSNISYTWKFSSSELNYDVSVIDKVVGTGRKLIIEDAQRANTGRYTCEISNDKGRSYTHTQYLFVYRPGKLEKEMIEVAGTEIDSGRKYWVDRDNGKWNKDNTKYDDMKDYSVEDEMWYDMVWSTESKEWQRKDLGVSIDKRAGQSEKINYVKRMLIGSDNISRQRSQGYWKYSGDEYIYWSDSVDVSKFTSDTLYFEHRDQLGYPEDYTDIQTIPDGGPNPYILTNDNIRII